MKISPEQHTEECARRALRKMGMFLRKRTDRESGESTYTIVNANEKPIYAGRNLSLDDVRNFTADEYAAWKRAFS